MKSVFVTGAAQGIGLAIARAFAAEGCRVGLFDLNEDKCRSLLDEPEFEHAVAGYCDVRDSISVTRALSEFAAQSGGRLDVLVNNAGVLTAGDFVDQTPEQIQAVGCEYQGADNDSSYRLSLAARHPQLRGRQPVLGIEYSWYSAPRGLQRFEVLCRRVYAGFKFGMGRARYFCYFGEAAGHQHCYGASARPEASQVDDHFYGSR